MDQQMFKVFMDRFDKLEDLHGKHREELAKHVESDNHVHAVVARHSTYWKLLSLGLPFVGASIAAKLGWK